MIGRLTVLAPTASTIHSLYRTIGVYCIAIFPGSIFSQMVYNTSEVHEKMFTLVDFSKFTIYSTAI